MRFVLTIFKCDMVHNSEIRKSLQVTKLFFFRIEQSQFCYNGHVIRIPRERITREILEAEPISRRLGIDHEIDGWIISVTSVGYA